jgi:cysteine desulfurase
MRIYLDHNATTPLDPEVRAEMDEALGRVFGNPSSLHASGQAARRIVDQARARVAQLIGAQPEEILFTSGGTESTNLALLGAAAGRDGQQPAILTTAIEHQAVLNPCRELERQGHAVNRLPVDAEGVLDLERLAAALIAGPTLASVMLANNDVGTIQPVAAAAALVKARGGVVHTDAVQAVGKLPVDVAALGVDLLSFSAHKLHGPKGIGALFLRRGTRLAPLLFGGHQERGLRPGTENVPAIAGFGKACALALGRLETDARTLSALRDRFEAGVLARIPDVRVNGGGASRLPNTSNLSFAGVDGEFLAIQLDLLGVEVSTGAACAASDHTPSHVLLAMGRTPLEARASIRFSFGRTNTPAEVDRAIDRLWRAVASLRESPP